jgi:hypothetical protein
MSKYLEIAVVIQANRWILTIDPVNLQVRLQERRAEIASRIRALSILTTSHIVPTDEALLTHHSNFVTDIKLIDRNYARV